MDLHKKRKFTVFLQMLATIFLFWILYRFAKKELDLKYLIISIIVYIGVMYIRFSVLTKNFYVQKFKKNKYLDIFKRISPIIAFFIIMYLPSNYGINAIAGGLVFNLGTVIEEKYTRYFTQVEYDDYMEKKKQKEKKKNKTK